VKILLLGKNGQVGWELQRALAPLGELIALDSRSPGPLQADFALPQALGETVRHISPQIIVNAAAHTAVDRAESEPELARLINATSVGVLAREAQRCGAWLVHFSTDYVFNGEGQTPWEENDATGPLNVYGQTKLEGENLIRDSGCQHLILRTSWVYGARGGNFAKTMLRLAAERDRLTVINDQFGAPTGADLLADLTAHMLRDVQQRPSLGGTYHAVAGGETTWHGYARHVIEWARAAGHPIKVAADGIQPVASSAFTTPATRPYNSRMNTQKLREAFRLRLPPWQVGVERMLSEFLGTGSV
jgi:dTDP-4-dehydrorhamnose reductase